MFKRLSFAHYLVAGGVLLGLLGLVLWWTLPITSSCPPFLVTPLLAIGWASMNSVAIAGLAHEW